MPSSFRRSGADFLRLLTGGTGILPAIRWLSGSGFYEVGGNVITRAGQVLFDFGALSWATTAAFSGPINAAASVMTSAQAGERWGGFFNAGTEAQNLPAIIVASTVLTVAQRYTIWNGVTLDATLPPNPPNGTLMTLLNIHSDAVDVLASGGDSIYAGANISIILDAFVTYAFLASSRTWYQVEGVL